MTKPVKVSKAIKKAVKQAVSNKRTRNRKQIERVEQAVARRPYQGALSDLGGKIGGLFGLSNLGSSAGDFIARITGWGDYKVQNNTLVTNSAPQFMLKGDGVRICHREFITDIVGATNFSNLTLPVNPGLSGCFPWLAGVTQAFEQYEMNGLVFEYRPSSGSAVSSTSAALGVVVYATNYDALDPPFVSKQAMEGYEFSTSTVPFQPMIHPVECAPGANPLKTMYIRNGSVPAGGDIRMYDIGTLQYAVQGMQSAYTVGELWVSYDVTLKKPRINPSANNGELALYQHLTSYPATSAVAGSPLGTSGLAKASSSNYDYMVDYIGNPNGYLVSNNTITIPNPGNYLLNVIWNASSIAAAPVVTPGSSFASNVIIFSDTTSNTGSFTSTTANYTRALKVTAYGVSSANQLVFTGLTGMATGFCDVFLLPLPAGTLN